MDYCTLLCFNLPQGDPFETAESSERSLSLLGQFYDETEGQTAGTGFSETIVRSHQCNETSQSRQIWRLELVEGKFLFH